MNLSLKKVASSLSFAHLAGLGRGKAAKADDDEKKDRDTEDVNDGAKKGKAEDDKPDEDDKKKDGPDARAEDDDPDAEDDQPEKKDDDADDKKAKKAKASDDDKKDDDKDDDEKMKAGATKERARCAAIFAAPAAARNVALAAELAFKTDLSAEQATGILEKTPAAAANLNRAAANPRIAGAAGPEVTGKQAVDSRWDRAFSQVTPQKRR